MEEGVGPEECSEQVPCIGVGEAEFFFDEGHGNAEVCAVDVVDGGGGERHENHEPAKAADRFNRGNGGFAHGGWGAFVRRG